MDLGPIGAYGKRSLEKRASPPFLIEIYFSNISLARTEKYTSLFLLPFPSTITRRCCQSISSTRRPTTSPSRHPVDTRNSNSAFSLYPSQPSRKISSCSPVNGLRLLNRSILRLLILRMGVLSMMSSSVNHEKKLRNVLICVCMLVFAR